MPDVNTKSKKGKLLDAIAAQVTGCTLCPLWKSRTNAVPGNGNPDAEIVIIGEGPGWHEDRQGLPFVGPSGQLLDKLLGSIGIKREAVFITNVVKCRPPNNRDPMPNEVETCNPYLTAQLDIIQPRLVITLGRYSMNLFLPDAKITQVHGQPYVDKRTGFTVVPMFHPAAALRQPAWMDSLTTDFKKLPTLLDGLSATPLPAPTPLPAAAPATTAVVEALADVPPVAANELVIAPKPKRGERAVRESGRDEPRPHTAESGAKPQAPEEGNRDISDIIEEAEPDTAKAVVIAESRPYTAESGAESQAPEEGNHDIIEEAGPIVVEVQFIAPSSDPPILDEPARAKSRRRAAVESDLAISAAAPSAKPKRNRAAAVAPAEADPDADWEELTGAVGASHPTEKRRGRPRNAEVTEPSAPNEQPPAAPTKPKPASRREKEEEAGQLTLF